MKIACLILCHKNVEQIGLLINALNHPDFYLLIHADKKMGSVESIRCNERVKILPESLRENVQWAQYSVVQATLNLVRFAKDLDEFDYFCLLSGQDYPIIQPSQILSFLYKNNGADFLSLFESRHNMLGRDNKYDKRCNVLFADWMIGRTKWQWFIKNAYIAFTGGYNYTWLIFKRRRIPISKFYFGSQWWCLTNRTITWMLDYCTDHPEYEKYFRLSLCPDEGFFHTLFMNSPFAENRQESIHYIDWSLGGNSPKTLTIDDYPFICESQKCFARKFDINVDGSIIQKLEESIFFERVNDDA